MNKKYVTLVVAIASTLTGLAAVVDPLVPDAYKGVVLVSVAVLNYLLLSPIASFFGVKALPEGK